MINTQLFHEPVNGYNNNELSVQSMYTGQKVQIIGYQTVFEEKEADEFNRVVEGCSTGSRHLFLNKKGYLDTVNGHKGTPDIIVLKDDALLLKHFKVKEIA